MRRKARGRSCRCGRAAQVFAFLLTRCDKVFQSYYLSALQDDHQTLGDQVQVRPVVRAQGETGGRAAARDEHQEPHHQAEN
jgi:hypothetical protein